MNNSVSSKDNTLVFEAGALVCRLKQTAVDRGSQTKPGTASLLPTCSAVLITKFLPLMIPKLLILCCVAVIFLSHGNIKS